MRLGSEHPLRPLRKLPNPDARTASANRRAAEARKPLRVLKALKVLTALRVLMGVTILALAACIRPQQAENIPTPTREPPPTHSVKAPTPVWTSTPRPTPTAPSARTATPSPSPSLTQSPARTPSPTATSTPTAQATPSATAASPTITTFQADSETADPGDTVELTWDSLGATSAVLYKLMVSGQLPADGIDVPVSGTMTYTISPEEQNWVSFLLVVWDEAETYAKATTTVRLRCSHDWFLAPPPEDICPTAPLVSAAAEQRFERGVMIWVEAEDAIYVLVGASAGALRGTHWSRFEDQWDETMPDRDPDLDPPEGLQQPIRGFGLVWREQPEGRDLLGWALNGETAYTTIMQRTTRYKYNAWVIRASDGHVWYLGPERSSWRRLTPTDIVSP